MSEIQIMPIKRIGRDFIPKEYLPKGKDEYYLRNAQAWTPPHHWRQLRSDEIEVLVKNGNTCNAWDMIMVADPFAPDLIKDNEFIGLVRIGRLERVMVQFHDLQMPAGITKSRVIACDIGDNCAVHNVRYLAHYILGSNVMLLNVDEMHVTNHAKFGNGIVKEGEPEDVRVWLEIMNETGCRAVMPFDGMIAADAYLWAKYRDDAALMKRLGAMTQRAFDSRRGYYGTVGSRSIIKSCRIIKDVKIGECCYIKGANKLKNLTINSSEEEPTQIGEGVELVNGIIGYGCHIFYGCKAVRFILGNNANLKYGARLLNSFLGDNSTISCCEALNNLIFPAHEQHHNNSFLIASLVMGQSNMAAGATVGSNHNSRANDGEIQAGRGFWPGLCTTLKHSSRFASFVLLQKGDYPAELDIPLPFSLVDNDVARDRLTVTPAFWWLYNMYALAHNSAKFQTRDKRKTKVQHIEFDYLAPDTVEELFTAMRLLEIWTARAHLKANPQRRDGQAGDDGLAKMGRTLLLDTPEITEKLEIRGERMEKSSRPVVILKARRGYLAYRDMILYYAVKNILAWLSAHPHSTLAAMAKALKGTRQRQWVNMGGQLVPAVDVDKLRADIRRGKISSWDDVHRRYDSLWERYPRDKQHHAYASLCGLLGTAELSAKQWRAACDEAARIQQYVCDSVYESRKKDYDNPFRQNTFRNVREQKAAIGTAEDNSFVKQIREETRLFAAAIRKAKKKR